MSNAAQSFLSQARPAAFQAPLEVLLCEVIAANPGSLPSPSGNNAVDILAALEAISGRGPGYQLMAQFLESSRAKYASGVWKA